MCTRSPERILVVLIVAVASAALAAPAAAQNYPWCSNFADGAGTNCGFSTEAQCKAEILGSGGYCEPNNLYKPVAAVGAAPARRHRAKPRAQGKH